MTDKSVSLIVNRAVSSGHPDELNRPERIAFFILLVIVGVRPLVGESYESSMGPILPLGPSPSGPGPVFPLTMGSLVLLAAALTIAGGVLRGEPMRRRSSGLAIGGVFVAMGMAISLFVASNRRLAMTASSDWLILIILCGLLVWLLRRPWQVRLLLCVLIATAAAFAGQCVLQRLVEFRDTITEYEARKGDFWTSQGVAAGDPKVQLYERRLYAREASGYFPHTNVAGSFLLLAAWAAAALAVVKLRGRGGAFQFGFGVLTAMLAAVLFGCILLTGSRGAMLAGVLTGVLAAGWMWLIPRLRWAWWARLLLGWLVVLAAAGTVVLAARHASPRSSMGFRWDYWRNTAALLGDYFWTGVGGQNFGRFYLQYKPVTDPEEIRDPHNFFLGAFAQWGVIGAAGLLAMGIGFSLRFARPCRPTGEEAPEGAHGAGGPERSPLPWFTGLAVGIFLLRLWTILGNQREYLFYATAVPLIVWCLTFAAMTLESDRFAFWCDSPISPAAGFVLLAGGLAFLLHGMIDVAVFYPGTATAFFAIMAAALAVVLQGARDDAGVVERPRGGRLRYAVVAAPVGLWLAHLIWLWLPATAVQIHLAAARQLVRLETGGDPAYSAALAEYQRAVDADTRDPTPPTEAAEWLLTAAVSDQPSSAEAMRSQLVNAARLINIAQNRDPQDIGIFRTKASICFIGAQRFRSLVEARVAVGAARSAVNLYPTSPQDRVLLAEAMVTQAWMEPAEGRAGFLADAIGQYEQALALDAERPGKIELRRWPARVRQELVDRIDELKAATSQPASQPASRPSSQAAS